MPADKVVRYMVADFQFHLLDSCCWNCCVPGDEDFQFHLLDSDLENSVNDVKQTVKLSIPFIGFSQVSTWLDLLEIGY